MSFRTSGTARSATTEGERSIARWMESEKAVARQLATMKANGSITGFTRYERDAAGLRETADFLVTAERKGRAVRRRFAVSTSLGAQRTRQGLFPRMRVLCIPADTKPTTIERRVLALFTR